MHYHQVADLTSKQCKVGAVCSFLCLGEEFLPDTSILQQVNVHSHGQEMTGQQRAAD